MDEEPEMIDCPPRGMFPKARTVEVDFIVCIDEHGRFNGCNFINSAQNHSAHFAAIRIKRTVTEGQGLVMNDQTDTGDEGGEVMQQNDNSDVEITERTLGELVLKLEKFMSAECGDDLQLMIAVARDFVFQAELMYRCGILDSIEKNRQKKRCHMTDQKITTQEVG